VTLLDLHLAAGARFEQTLPGSYNGFVYVLEGSASIGDRALTAARSDGWRPRAPRPWR
jgi:redox-sensitive bicupin YhaK (pirin superfamily)